MFKRVLGRFRNTLNQYDVSKMLYSNEQLEEAKELIEVYSSSLNIIVCLLMCGIINSLIRFKRITRRVRQVKVMIRRCGMLKS